MEKVLYLCGRFSVDKETEMGTYEIPIRGLKEGKTSYNFLCDKAFFSQMEDSLVEDGNLEAVVDVRRSGDIVRLGISITGTIKATCDICLGEFDYEVEDCGGEITLKLGEKFEEVGDDVYEVDRAEEGLSVAQWLYEFVCVSLPIRMEHPRDENGERTCDKEMLRKIAEYSSENQDRETTENEKSGEETIDPRWAILKGLKDED